ncbi:hypothetical protein [Arcobacter arenosus]
MKKFLKKMLDDFEEVIKTKEIYYILLVVISLMIYILVGFLFLGI